MKRLKTAPSSTPSKLANPLETHKPSASGERKLIRAFSFGDERNRQVTVAEELEKVKGHCAIRQAMRSASRPHHRQVHGFTLIDLVMVLVITGIAVAIAAPRLTTGMTRYRAEATARRIVADLERARAEAIARSEAVEVVFDFTANSYTVTGVESLDHDSANSTLVLSEGPYNATLLSAFDKSLNDLTEISLQFDGHGKPSRHGKVIVEVNEGDQRQVMIDSASGSIYAVTTD